MEAVWEAVIALVSLTALEIVLGIDNIVFIAILSERVEKPLQSKARLLGLFGSMFTRVLLLLAISWIMHLGTPWWSFDIGGHHVDVSWKAIIVMAGGLFLIAKSTFEVHDKLEGPNEDENAGPRSSLMQTVIVIMLMDIIFSIDSVLTAVGMVEPEMIWVMITSIILSIGVMMLFANPISAFIQRHPTVKMLALSFLLLIGVMLVADGVGFHIPRGYIYFAMTFSLFVELLNIRLRKVSKPVPLNTARMPDADEA